MSGASPSAPALPPVRWRVGFTDGAAYVPRLYRRFLRPGFRHCWAARHVCRGLWVYFEWTAERQVMGLVPSSFIREQSRAAACVLAFTGEAVGGERKVHAPLVSVVHCSVAVAHALGLRGGWTPWRLACALRRRGAVMLMRHPAGGWNAKQGTFTAAAD